jgi:hypothetical protein
MAASSCRRAHSTFKKSDQEERQSLYRNIAAAVFVKDICHADSRNRISGRTNCSRQSQADKTGPEQHLKTIVPYSLFDEMILHGRDANSGKRISKGLLDLDPPPRFELVIVDEAHHIRNTATYVHQGVRFFCEHAEALVFLSQRYADILAEFQKLVDTSSLEAAA